MTGIQNTKFQVCRRTRLIYKKENAVRLISVRRPLLSYAWVSERKNEFPRFSRFPERSWESHLDLRTAKFFPSIRSPFSRFPREISNKKKKPSRTNVPARQCLRVGEWASPRTRPRGVPLRTPIREYIL